MCIHDFLITWIHRSTSKAEKRPLDNENEDEISDNEDKRKKARTDDDTKVTESILDDINLQDIESRISVHVIESPESCTHEVAVYPGKKRFLLDVLHHALDRAMKC